MGIAIWGIIERFSRRELALWAVPNARLSEVPALILRLIHKLGGTFEPFCNGQFTS